MIKKTRIIIPSALIMVQALRSTYGAEIYPYLISYKHTVPPEQKCSKAVAIAIHIKKI